MAPLLRQTPEEVIKTSEWAVGFNIRHFGEDSGQACRAREDLAKSLDAVGRHTEARVLREQVVSACRRNRGPEDEQTLDAELWLVVSLAREGLTGEALPLAVHVRDGRRTNGTDDGKADEWVRALTRSPEPPDA
jgi:hypothetical protein